MQQTERLTTAIQEKRPNRKHGDLLLQENSHMTKEAIEARGWEVLPIQPYSLEWAPSDFHLFPSLSNAMREDSSNIDAELRA